MKNSAKRDFAKESVINLGNEALNKVQKFSWKSQQLTRSWRRILEIEDRYFKISYSDINKEKIRKNKEVYKIFGPPLKKSNDHTINIHKGEEIKVKV
jgi:hypothetical protein